MSFLDKNVSAVRFMTENLRIGASIPGQAAHVGPVNIRGFNGRAVNVMGTSFPRPASRYGEPVLGDWQDLETLSTSWNPNIVVPNADETPRIRRDVYRDGLVIVYLDGYFEHVQADPPASPRATFAANDVLFVLPDEYTPPGTLHFINFGEDRQVQSPGTGRRTSGGLRVVGIADTPDKGKYVKNLVGVEVSLAGVFYSV